MPISSSTTQKASAASGWAGPARRKRSAKPSSWSRSPISTRRLSARSGRRRWPSTSTATWPARTSTRRRRPRSSGRGSHDGTGSGSDGRCPAEGWTARASRSPSGPSTARSFRRLPAMTNQGRHRRLVILAEGNFGFHHGKTAVGVIRYGSDDVVAVIDSTQAGGNVSSLLPGRDIPIVATLDEALVRSPRPDTLLIGIAPTGGKLPDSWRTTILAAIRAGLDVHSGLHTFIGDDPEFAAAAEAAGTRIVDYRRPPTRME